MGAALRLQKPHFEPTPAPVAKVLPSQEPARAPTAPPVVEVSAVATPMKKTQCLEGTALQSAIQAFIKEKGEGVEEGIGLTAICSHVSPAPETHIRKALEM